MVNKRTRRWTMGVVGVVTALISGLMVAEGSSALLGQGAFEIDGDLTGALDWSVAATPAGSSAASCTPPLAAGFSCGVDKPTGQSDDSFGNGTKEDTPVPSVIDGSIPNNKSDLTRFYVAKNKHLVNGVLNDFVHLAWERVQEPSGTTNMDFEFNQSQGLSPNKVTPERSKGDLLIKFDLSQGGTTPTFGMHVWQDGSPGFNEPCEASTRKPCWGQVNPLTGSVAAGDVNDIVTTDPIQPGAPRDLSPRTFGEASINLTAAKVLDPARCTSFGSAYLKSRSSDSFTAALKDFIAPIPVDISNCQPATINLLKYDTRGTDDIADDAELSGATLQLWRETNGVAGLQTTASGEAVADTLLKSCTSNESACSGYTTSTSGTYYGVEAAAPAGYGLAPTVTQPVTIGQAAQTFNLRFRDAPAPGDINIAKVDDANNPLDGVVFTLYKDVDPFSTDSHTEPGDEDLVAGNIVTTCTTASDLDRGAAGECKFSSVALGTYWVVETTGPGSAYGAAAPKHVTIGLGAAPGEGQEVSLSFTNARKHRVIVVVCHEGTNTLASSNVSIGGQAPVSSLAAPPAGVTEAELCGITTGASFGGLPHEETSIAVTVGGH